VIVAGRQIATRDGLEVLALCQDSEYPTDLAIDEAVEAVKQQGAIPVIPWGFGKWWFRRGALVSRLLESAKHPQLFLGDNGGRLRGAPRPKLFQRANDKGVLILPGSDPLPFPEQSDRAGSYGFVLETDIDLKQPAHELGMLLRAATKQPRTFGQLEAPSGFVKNQIAMQLRKRGIGRAR
jgi:hypothetical protein